MDGINMDVSSRTQTAKRGRRILVGERVLKLIIEGRIRVVQGKKLKLGKYKIKRRSKGGGCKG